MLETVHNCSHSPRQAVRKHAVTNDSFQKHAVPDVWPDNHSLYESYQVKTNKSKYANFSKE